MITWTEYAHRLLTGPWRQGRPSRDKAHIDRAHEKTLKPHLLPVFLPEAVQGRIRLWASAGMLTRDERNTLNAACAIMRRLCGENLRDEAHRALAASIAAAERRRVAANKHRRLAERRADRDRVRLARETES